MHDAMSKKELTSKGESGSLSGIVETAKEIARKRAALVSDMRDAFLEGKDDVALSYAKELCGLQNHEESNRVNSRIN